VKKAREAEELSKKQDREAEKRAKQEAEKDEQIIDSLKRIQSVSKDLRDGKLSTKDAIDKLKDISDKIPE
jgi:hypothetical protein